MRPTSLETANSINEKVCQGLGLEKLSVEERIKALTNIPIEDVWFVRRLPELHQIVVGRIRPDLQQVVTTFADVLGVENPDLSAFKAHGGKILTWHGLADSLITPELTIQYRAALERTWAGQKRLMNSTGCFLAPGVDHCWGGYGPSPVDDFGVLVKWVEEGVAPDVLPASRINDDGVNVTRNLCQWPRLLTYNGEGDMNDASSFSCT
ncbi:tannase and feruloyl esterase-domain-containing protein [Leptodontidium sp. MPI-SDFR-AT-0119]|nr:tannase and feruloyl esterase-domain-containing protein [Leptodontidium sp. MPI-SDFR-AT-0119]